MKIHGDKYDYSKVNYIKNKSKIIIICKRHGEFKQTPNSHLSGMGCFKCGREICNDKLKKSREDFIKEAIEKHDASSGGVGVMDPITGEILAIANYPSFDLNHASTTSAKLKKMAFITDPFEPGSVFKIFTIASALENKVITPETKFFCEKGRYKVDNHYITEADTDKKHEWLTVSDIIKYSSNIGTTKIAFDLTYPKFKKTLAKFNIGEKTGIEFPSESRGILTKETKVKQLTFSNMSFGQGVATTALQMLAGYAAIANNGVYVTPTLLKVDDLKNVKHIEDLVDNLHHEQFPNIIEIVVKGTKDPLNITKKVLRRGEEEITETSHQTPGLENSVLTCTQFGNQAGRLNPQGPINRQDDFTNQLNRQVDYLTKTSKEIFKNKKLKKSSK
jgi:membrane carboxypeptidase/penicillin-binding protein